MSNKSLASPAIRAFDILAQQQPISNPQLIKALVSEGYTKSTAKRGIEDLYKSKVLEIATGRGKFGDPYVYQLSTNATRPQEIPSAKGGVVVAFKSSHKAASGKKAAKAISGKKAAKSLKGKVATKPAKKSVPVVAQPKLHFELAVIEKPTTIVVAGYEIKVADLGVLTNALNALKESFK